MATKAQRRAAADQITACVRELLLHLPADELADVADLDAALGLDRHLHPKVLRAPGRSYTAVRGASFRIDRDEETGRQRVTAFRRGAEIGRCVEHDEPDDDDDDYEEPEDEHEGDEAE